MRLFYNCNFVVTMREEWSDAMFAMNKSGRSNIYIESPSRVAAPRGASRELRYERSREKPRFRVRVSEREREEMTVK